MIPKAKKNLHECKYHLNNMINSANVEELEINFAAFVNSARNVTFVLQKEFAGNEKFEEWYASKEKEMRNDNLLDFFKNLRNKIVKEGINHIEANTIIKKFNSSKDLINRPPNSSFLITGKGIFYMVKEGTPQEDLVPAKTKGEILSTVFIENSPTEHLGKKILNNNIIEISKLYYTYCLGIVEEWIGIIIAHECEEEDSNPRRH